VKTEEIPRVQEKSRRRFLSPVERISEVLFGLIMTLSITGTMSVVSGGREEVGITLIAVLGCNIAWGIIDAILYLLGAISDNSRGKSLYTMIAQTSEPEKALAAIAGSLPPTIAKVLLPEEIESIHRRLVELPEESQRKIITREDIGGAVGVFLIVVLSCVPVILPFILMRDPLPALRVSNLIAMIMLFAGGYSFAKYAGLARITTGIIMVVLGAAMVGLTIALGG
jgi:VIT1/CCC1 family predicted Fe2+/Mn2+ transporter